MKATFSLFRALPAAQTRAGLLWFFSNLVTDLKQKLQVGNLQISAHLHPSYRPIYLHTNVFTNKPAAMFYIVWSSVVAL